MAHALSWNLLTILLSVQGLLLIKSLAPLFGLFLALMHTTNSSLFTGLIAVDWVLGYQHMPFLQPVLYAVVPHP